MAVGHPGLVTPGSTSEFQAMIEQMVAHHNRMSTQAQVVGAELKLQLPKARGGALSRIRVDLHLSARMIQRQFAQAAAANTSAAAAYRHAERIFIGSFTDQGRHATGFDLDG